MSTLIHNYQNHHQSPLTVLYMPVYQPFIVTRLSESILLTIAALNAAFFAFAI